MNSDIQSSETLDRYCALVSASYSNCALDESGIIYRADEERPDVWHSFSDEVRAAITEFAQDTGFNIDLLMSAGVLVSELDDPDVKYHPEIKPVVRIAYQGQEWYLEFERAAEGQDHE